MTYKITLNEYVNKHILEIENAENKDFDDNYISNYYRADEYIRSEYRQM